MKILLLSSFIITGLAGAMSGKTADISQSESAIKDCAKLVSDIPMPNPRSKKCPLLADIPMPNPRSKKCPLRIA